MNYLSSVTSAVNIVSTVRSWYGEKTEPVLHPMTTLVRLALLDFKEPGTKVRIKPRKIEYLPPGWLEQSIPRTFSPESFKDLQYLNTPIQKVSMWYRPDQDQKIRAFFEHASIGLERLGETYASENKAYVRDSLDKHRLVIEKSMAGKQTQVAEEASVDARALWETTEIESVHGLLALATAKREKKSSFASEIKAIEALLDGKDGEFEALIAERLTNV